MPQLTVIVPNYNHAAFLPKRLESVFSQTYRDFEVILLDDCSTDGSVEILQPYACHPKTAGFIVNNQNSGSPFYQWKKGFEMAKGKYLWVAESDDWCETNFVEKLLPFLSDTTGIAYCRSIGYDESTGAMTKDFFPEELDKSRWKSNFVAEGTEEIKKYHLYRNTIPNASSCIFDKDILDLQDEALRMRICGDWLFWANLMKKTRVAYLSETLNTWRFSDQTVRSRKSFPFEKERMNEFFRCVSEMKSFSGKQRLRFSTYAYFFDWFFNANPRWLLRFLFRNPAPFPPVDYYRCLSVHMVRQLRLWLGVRLKQFTR